MDEIAAHVSDVAPGPIVRNFLCLVLLSSDGRKLSLDVSTLDHDILQLDQ